MIFDLKDIIKFIYNLIIFIVIFLIFLIIASFFKGNEFEYSLLWILIVNLIIFSICIRKEIDYKIIYALNCFSTLILTLCLGETRNIYIYLIINIVCTSIALKNSNKPISREYFFYRLKKICIFLGGLLFLYIFIDEDIQIQLTKIYFIEFVLGITLLRTARNYEYGLENKTILRNTGAIVLGLFIITSKNAIEIIRSVFKFLIHKFDFLIDILLKGISMIFYNFNNLFLKLGFKVKVKDLKIQDNGIKNKFKVIETHTNSVNIIIFKIITIFIVLGCLVLIIKWATKNKNTIIRNYKVNKEEIKRERLCKDTNMIKRIKKIFNKPKTNKERILFAFYLLERKLYKKNIFKIGMNATQIYKANAYRIQNKEELKYITEKYNEVKFSKHELEQQPYNEFMEDFKKVKKEL